MQETRFRHKSQPRGEVYQLGWELLDQGPLNQEGGVTLVSTLRKQGPGWDRALDPQVPPQHQGRLSHTLVWTDSGVTCHWFNIYGRSGCPQECTELLTLALECAESLGDAVAFIRGDLNITLEGTTWNQRLIGQDGPTC